MALSAQELKVVAIVVKCTALLSICGSSWIIQSVLRDKRKRNVTYHRLMLGMSVSDMLSSITMVIGSWAIPRANQGLVFQPIGNAATCATQGFFVQLGITTPIYNASLSLYYVLLVKYRFQEDDFRRHEPWFHGTAWGWGFTTAVTGAALDMYHNSNLWCWIAEGGATDKVQANWCRWLFYYCMVWLVIAVATTAAFVLYWEVKQAERHVASMTPRESCQFQLSNGVYQQAVKYVSAFLLSFIFATLTRLIQTINGRTYFPIILLMAIFFPMQGFLNFLVYIQKSYNKVRNSDPSLTVYQAIMLVLKDDVDKSKEHRISRFSESKLSHKIKTAGISDAADTGTDEEQDQQLAETASDGKAQEKGTAIVYDEENWD